MYVLQFSPIRKTLFDHLVKCMQLSIIEHIVVHLPCFRPVERVVDVMSLVQFGLRTRRETATMVHEHSSRSHLVVTLTVNSQAPSFFSISKPPTPTQDGVPGRIDSLKFVFILC